MNSFSSKYSNLRLKYERSTMSGCTDRDYKFWVRGKY